MEFREFIKSRFCKPLVLAPEDEVQDVTEWRRLVREDQERQFAQYGEPAQVVDKTDEERRVEEFLASKNLPVPVLAESREGALPSAPLETQRPARESTDGNCPTLRETTRGGQKFNKVAYQREYMRKRRAAQKSK